jgi:hypothetical protein
VANTETPANGRHRLRGRPFPKGNPGRTPGSKNKATVIAESLLEDETEELMRIAIELAKAGDKDMLKFLLGRVLPKERTVRLDLPAIDSAAGAVDALASVTAAVSTGEITPSEGAPLGSLIGSCSRTIENGEMEARIDHLEDRQQSESFNETKIPAARAFGKKVG